MAEDKLSSRPPPGPPAQQVSDWTGGPHSIRIRQCPDRAKLVISKSDKAEKDRKPVDPPPIIQLKLGNGLDPNNSYLQSPYFFMSVTLWQPKEDSPAPWPQHQSLAGTLVSSLHRLKDQDDQDGGFFVFGDLSVRVEGEWRLCFDLFQLREGSVHRLSSITSAPFKVLTAKEFPGMSQSTSLSRSFGEQGVKLRLRKETRSTGRKRTAAIAGIHTDGSRQLTSGMPMAYSTPYQPGYVPSEPGGHLPYVSGPPHHPSSAPLIMAHESYPHGEAIKRQRMSLDLTTPHQPPPISPRGNSLGPPPQNHGYGTSIQVQSPSLSHQPSAEETGVVIASPSRPHFSQGFTGQGSNSSQQYPDLRSAPHLPSARQLPPGPVIVSAPPRQASPTAHTHPALFPGMLVANQLSAHSGYLPRAHMQLDSSTPRPYGLNLPQAIPQSGEAPTMNHSNPLTSPFRETPPTMPTTTGGHASLQTSPTRLDIQGVSLTSPHRTSEGGGLTLPPLQPTNEPSSSASGPAQPPKIGRPDDLLSLGPPSKFESASVRRGTVQGGVVSAEIVPQAS